jgi:hypothetical protein
LEPRTSAALTGLALFLTRALSRTVRLRGMFGPENGPQKLNALSSLSLDDLLVGMSRARDEGKRDLCRPREGRWRLAAGRGPPRRRRRASETLGSPHDGAAARRRRTLRPWPVRPSSRSPTDRTSSPLPAPGSTPRGCPECRFRSASGPQIAHPRRDVLRSRGG